jgi:hypothetical protein
LAAHRRHRRFPRRPSPASGLIRIGTAAASAHPATTRAQASGLRARGIRPPRGRLPPPARGRHLAPQPAAAPSPIVSRPSVGGPLRGFFIPPCRPSCHITGDSAHLPFRPQHYPKIRPWRFTLRAGAPTSHNCALMGALRDYTQGPRIRHHKPSYATLAFNATGCLVIDPFAFSLCRARQFWGRVWRQV